MQLTHYTDYALRVLIFLSLQKKETRTNVSEIAGCFGMSRNHVMKIVHRLGQLEFIQTTRGKGGGIQLKQHASEIKLGDVVRKMEATLEIVNCDVPPCPIRSACHLKGILNLARDAFLHTLDQYSLADLSRQPEQLTVLLQGMADITQ